MRRKPDWNERYRLGNLPWDTGRHDLNLSEIVKKKPIEPCKALEVGCGTGTNAIWLSRQGFSVTAIDIVEIAIEKAIEKASKAEVRCNFFTADFMKQKIKGAPFGFIFDRGCLHSFDSARDRKKYARIAHSYLKKGGLWLTLVGSADDPPREIGPPQRSARDIIIAVETYFEILSLYTSHFDSNMEGPPKAWVCLMYKRT